MLLSLVLVYFLGGPNGPLAIPIVVMVSALAPWAITFTTRPTSMAPLLPKGREADEWCLDNPAAVKLELERLAASLDRDEKVAELIQGNHGMAGLIAVTTHRVLFVAQGVFNDRLDSYSHEDITRVAVQCGAFGRLEIGVGGDVVRFTRVVPKIHVADVATEIECRVKARRGPRDAGADGPGTSPVRRRWWRRGVRAATGR